MAKVILLTSRKIFNCFKLIDNLVEKLVYSDKYISVITKHVHNVGIVTHILQDKYAKKSLYPKMNDAEKNNPDEVAKLVIPDHVNGKRGDFTAGVFRYPKKNPEDEHLENIYYFAIEYPYFGDACMAKYAYMDALLEMIFKDLEGISIEEFKIFSHDRDWGVQGNKVSVLKKEAMSDYSNICRFFDKCHGQVMVFQNTDNYFNEEIVNMFPISLKRIEQ